jgi:hypothetical protein
MFPGVLHMVEDVCPGQARQQTDPELRSRVDPSATGRSHAASP